MTPSNNDFSLSTTGRLIQRQTDRGYTWIKVAARSRQFDKRRDRFEPWLKDKFLLVPPTNRPKEVARRLRQMQRGVA